MCDQGTCQDQNEGDMHEEGEKTLVTASGHEIYHAADGQYRPQYDEYRTVIEMAEREIRPVKLFNDRGSHHHYDDGCQRSIAQVFGCFLHDYIDSMNLTTASRSSLESLENFSTEG